jgi:hypothetical protein
MCESLGSTVHSSLPLDIQVCKYYYHNILKCKINWLSSWHVRSKYDCLAENEEAHFAAGSCVQTMDITGVAPSL